MRKGIGISGIVRAWGLKDLHYTVRILFLSGSMTRKQLHHALDTALGNIEEEVISIDDLLDSRKSASDIRRAGKGILG